MGVTIGGDATESSKNAHLLYNVCEAITYIDLHRMTNQTQFKNGNG